MHPINKADNSYKNKYDKPPENEENLIDKLHPDVLKKIISHLDPISLEASTSVEKSWNKETVTHVRTEDYNQATRYLELLSQSLKAASTDDLKEKLIALAEDRSILKAVNLREIQARNLELQDQLASVLMELSEEDLSTLEKKGEPPELFKHIFNITRIYKAIENPAIDDEELLNGIAQLLEYKCFDKSVEASCQLMDEDEKIGVLTSVIANIALSNQMKKAWALINHPPVELSSLSQDDFATHCLLVASSLLFSHGKGEMAEEFFLQLPNDDLKAQVLVATIKDKTTQNFTAMSRVVSLLSSHYAEHPDSYSPSFDLEAQIDKLSERIGIKDPDLANQIVKDFRS